MEVLLMRVFFRSLTLFKRDFINSRKIALIFLMPEESA